MSDDYKERRRAEHALNLGKTEEARRILGPLLARWPEDGEVLALSAEAARQSGEIATARSLLARAAAAAPDDPEVLVVCGLVASRNGDSLDTHRWVSRALELDPSNVQGQNLMALALNALGQPDAARAHLDVALSLSPLDPMVLNTAGILEKDTGISIVWWARAMQAQPDYHVALGNLGLILVDLGALRRGTMLLGRAVALDPAWVEARGMLVQAGISARRILEGRLALVVAFCKLASWISPVAAVAVAVLGAAWLVASLVAMPRPLRSRLGHGWGVTDVVLLLLIAVGVLVPPVALLVGAVILGGRWRDRVVAFRGLRAAGLPVP